VKNIVKNIPEQDEPIQQRGMSGMLDPSFVLPEIEN